MIAMCPGNLLSWTALMACVYLAGCTPGKKSPQEREYSADAVTKDFRSDVEFLRRYTDVIILEESSGQAKIAVSPALQGRVMTSTASGDGGLSHGWINRDAFLSGDTSEHMNAFGGEDRFWLGPEGGQYSIFFSPGKPFDLRNWHVPRIIDLEPFDIKEKAPSTAVFTRDGELLNYSGTLFQFTVNRRVSVIERARALATLGVDSTSGLSIIAYESSNVLRNRGNDPWSRDGGVLSVWILGMYNPDEKTTIIIPHRGKSNTISQIVNDRYFGRVPVDRLRMDEHAVFFRGDGRYRSKIGLPPEHATSWLGSYDASHGVLTLVTYNKPGTGAGYVNSAWEIQADPYKGDVINAYNDGPPSPGERPLGPFYELETSSPAAELGPGDSIVHVHTTYHLQGSNAQLDPVMNRILGVTSEEVRSVFH